MTPAAPGSRLRIQAPAKVNLVLRILERSPDGYHELETLFQAVSLQDTLTLTVLETSGAFELRTHGPEVGPVEDNLVTRAVHLFREAGGGDFGVRAELTKRIPSGAGLGGGSSDAGATLRVLNTLGGESLTPEELRELGARLGADVAFFAGTAGLAEGTGRGDRLRSLPALPERGLVVGCPRVHVATGPAYQELARERVRTGRIPPRVLDTPVPEDWDGIESLAVNDFEGVIVPLHPEIRIALEALRNAGLRMPLLSGSGAAVFGVVPHGGDTPAIMAELRRGAPEVEWHAVRTLARLPAGERVDSDLAIG